MSALRWLRHWSPGGGCGCGGRGGRGRRGGRLPSSLACGSPCGVRNSGPRGSPGAEGPPGARSPGGGSGGRNSFGVSFASPFLSSFFKEAGALAISSSSMIPSPFASSTRINGEGGGRWPMRRGAPDPSGPGPPPGPASRGGGRSRGCAPSASCAVIVSAELERASVRMSILLCLFIFLSCWWFAFILRPTAPNGQWRILPWTEAFLSCAGM